MLICVSRDVEGRSLLRAGSDGVEEMVEPRGCAEAPELMSPPEQFAFAWDVA